MSCLGCKGEAVAAPKFIRQRRDFCRVCEHSTRSEGERFKEAKGLTSRSRCRVCDCAIVLMTKQAAARCPKGIWVEIPAD